MNTCCEAEEPKPSAAFLLAPPSDDIQAMTSRGAAEGGDLLISRRERAGRQVGVEAAVGDRPATAESRSAQRQGGLRRGAAEATGEVGVVAAVGDHSAAAQCRAADRGGVLAGKAERAGSEVAVVAAVGDGHAMTASDAAEGGGGLIGLAERALGDVQVAAAVGDEIPPVVWALAGEMELAAIAARTAKPERTTERMVCFPSMLVRSLLLPGVGDRRAETYRAGARRRCGAAHTRDFFREGAVNEV